MRRGASASYPPARPAPADGVACLDAAEDDEFRCVFQASSELQLQCGGAGVRSSTSEAALLAELERALRLLDDRRRRVQQAMSAAGAASSPLSARQQRLLEHSRHEAMRAAGRLHRLWMQWSARREDARERPHPEEPALYAASTAAPSSALRCSTDVEGCWLLFHELAAVTQLLHSALTASLRLQRRSQRPHQAASSRSPKLAAMPPAASASSSPASARAGHTAEVDLDVNGADADEAEEGDEDGHFGRLHLWLDQAKRTLHNTAQEEEREQRKSRATAASAASSSSSSSTSSLSLSSSPSLCRRTHLHDLGLSVAGAAVGALLASAAPRTPPTASTASFISSSSLTLALRMCVCCVCRGPLLGPVLAVLLGCKAGVAVAVGGCGLLVGGLGALAGSALQPSHSSRSHIHTDGAVEGKAQR